MNIAPDLVEPVLGFRVFDLGPDPLLRSPWMDGWVWQPGVVTARCRQTHLTVWGVSHVAPGRNCACGLYAYRELEGRLHEGAGCVGAIAAWGEMELHPTGFRAQHACVVALAAAAGAGMTGRELIARTAERYGVKSVPLRKLSEEGLRHARPVSMGGRPRAKRSWVPV